MLGSRKPQERAAGASALFHIADHDVGIHSNRKLVAFQEAVVAAGGIPLIVRVLGRPVCGGDAAYVIYVYARGVQTPGARGCDCSGGWYSASDRASCVAAGRRAGERYAVLCAS
jgi:hypothetical protein